MALLPCAHPRAVAVRMCCRQSVPRTSTCSERSAHSHHSEPLPGMNSHSGERFRGRRWKYFKGHGRRSGRAQSPVCHGWGPAGVADVLSEGHICCVMLMVPSSEGGRFEGGRSVLSLAREGQSLKVAHSGVGPCWSRQPSTWCLEGVQRHLVPSTSAHAGAGACGSGTSVVGPRVGWAGAASARGLGGSFRPDCTCLRAGRAALSRQCPLPAVYASCWLSS